MITSDATEEPDLQLAVGGFRHLAARFVGDMQDLLDAMQATIDGSAELLSTIGAEELAKLGEESICNGCGMDTTPYDDHHRPVPGWEWYHVRERCGRQRRSTAPSVSSASAVSSSASAVVSCLATSTPYRSTNRRRSTPSEP
jgi:hypothetical protein